MHNMLICVVIQLTCMLFQILFQILFYKNFISVTNNMHDIMSRLHKVIIMALWLVLEKY